MSVRILIAGARLLLALSCLASLSSCVARGSPSSPAPAASSSTDSSKSRASPAGLSKAIFVGCGYLLTESHGDVHFELKLLGADVRQIPNEEFLWWLVDGVFVESTAVVASQMGTPDARGPELLRRHMIWETEYTAEQNGWPPVTPHAEPPFQVNGFDALSWTYRFPSPVSLMDQQITGVIYSAVAVDHVVFAIAAPLRGAADVRPGVDVMFKALQTIERTTAPTDVEALSRELKSDPAKPWSGCSQAPAETG